MLFDDEELIANEEILYEGKPSFLFTCKNVILGFVLIAFILGSTITILSTISELEVYSFDSFRYPIAQYVAFAIYGFVFLILIWMIWKLVNWYFIKYIVTDGRIIAKSGIIRENKSYMSFKNVQDIKVSRSIFQRLVGVGTVEITSAYDNSNVVLKNIRAAREVEEIIYNGMNSLPNYPSMNYPDYYQDNSQGYNPYPNPNNQFNQQNHYQNQGYSQRNIKNDYTREHHSNYDPEEEYRKGLDNPLSGLSNKPLNNNYDNEIYYNDYQAPDTFDETINQAVRNIEGNVKFKGDNYPHQNGDYRRGINSSKSNLVYEGNSFRDNSTHNDYQQYRNSEYNPNLRSNYENRAENYHPQGGNYSSQNRENNYYSPMNQYEDNKNYNQNNQNNYPNNQYYQQNNYNSNHNQYNKKNPNYRNNYQEYNNKKNSSEDVKKSDKSNDSHVKKNRKSVLAKHARKFQK
ncbi:PH domain-containing protein [uncultured Methanobrevibacter sp.]|uniref:PH domain-containing protein n=1 Tax=uncultured Methanobrevibacter sp. TaxID=253161 RepID=UPI0025DB62CC|nr:PH domain-containing protein [uncultured Methanobrevibacter sp.]